LDNYLSLAVTVLRDAKRPLTPREIMHSAYKIGGIPNHLHGRTQHKTLQARLSEDILRLRDRSAFFRTEPGRFFLREFISDQTLPEKYRIPIIARRRMRELPRHNALALHSSCLALEAVESVQRDTSSVLSYLAQSCFHYVPSSKDRSKDDVLVWSFVIVTRGDMVLSYRHGKYREGRDSFFERRSIGFYNLIVDNDLGLFDQFDHGILNSGIRAMCIDLDIPGEALYNREESPKIEAFLYSDRPSDKDLLAVITVDCPEWFEPTNRRLAINDLGWFDVSRMANHMDDLDPWSQVALDYVRRNAI
jgi:hypothetical protein